MKNGFLKKLASLSFAAILTFGFTTVTKAEETVPDTTPPIVSYMVSPNPNDLGWNNGPIQVSIRAADDIQLSKICYKFKEWEQMGLSTREVDAYGKAAYIFMNLFRSGKYTLIYWAIDTSGNVSTVQEAYINIDYESPTITGSTTTQPNQNGWFNHDVIVHFDGTDATSGVYKITPDTIVSQEGTNNSVTGTVEDFIHQTASTTVSGINIDKTSPTVTGAATTQPNQNGWYNLPVTVHFDGTDALSGIDTSSITPDVTIEEEGQNLLANGSAMDLAGNVGSTTVSGINIDRTAPTIAYSGLEYNDTTFDFTVPFNQSAYWEALDNLSGVAGTSSGIIDTSSIGQKTKTITAVDKAGNAFTVDLNYTVVDKTPPIVTGTPTTQPNQYGWYNAPVTVHFDGTDALSGIDTSSITPDVTIDKEGQNLSVSGSAKDLAGNVGSVNVTGINIDKTSPIVTGTPTTQPNQYGWYNLPVTIHFNGTDALSGIDTSSISPDVTIDKEGQNLSTSGSVMDLAGNTGSISVSGINIDRTAPTVYLDEIENGGTVYLNQSAHWGASDTLSGLATPSSGVIDTSSIGKKTMTINAIDKAGNANIVVVDYTVISYSNFIPLNKTEKLQAVKEGTNFTIKFQLADASGNYISTATPKVTLINSSGVETKAVSTSNTTNKGLDTNQCRYDFSSNQYIFNLNTKDLLKDNYTIKITLNDNSYYTLPLNLK